MTAVERGWQAFVRSLGCVVCRRSIQTGLPVELHHVARGSGVRSEFAVVPLCGSIADGGHHRGAGGFHGLGERRFAALYRPPGDSETGMLIWLIEDVAAAIFARVRR